MPLKYADCDMELTDIIGTIAATLTTISFFPQAAKIIKSHDTSGISLPMYVIFIAGVSLWLVYGIILGSWPIIIANFITLFPTSIILAIKLRSNR